MYTQETCGSDHSTWKTLGPGVVKDILCKFPETILNHFELWSFRWRHGQTWLISRQEFDNTHVPCVKSWGLSDLPEYTFKTTCHQCFAWLKVDHLAICVSICKPVQKVMGKTFVLHAYWHVTSWSLIPTQNSPIFRIFWWKLTTLDFAKHLLKMQTFFLEFQALKTSEVVFEFQFKNLASRTGEGNSIQKS